MAIPDETLATSALCPTVMEADHNDRELRSLRIFLLVLIVIESISAVAAMIFHSSRRGVSLLPQVLIGFVALAVILIRDLSSQRRTMREVSAALVAANSYVERLEQMSLIDPTTQLFNRRYLAEVFNHQLKGWARTGKQVTLLLLEVLASEQNASPEQIIIEAAFILRSNFRASDFLVRYDGNQFLVVLPDTNAQQAQIALSRLIDKIGRWNTANMSREIGLCLELSTCIPDAKMWERLNELEEKLRDKNPPELRILAAGAR